MSLVEANEETGYYPGNYPGRSTIESLKEAHKVIEKIKVSNGNKNSESFEKSEHGAVRSTDADDIRYDLISHIGLRRLAVRYAVGSAKYGDYNWLKGFKASSTIKHLLKHFWLWFAGDRSDDHLAAVAWGIFTLMHFEETRPELIDVPMTHEKVMKAEKEKEEYEKKERKRIY